MNGAGLIVGGDIASPAMTSKSRVVASSLDYFSGGGYFTYCNRAVSAVL